MLYNIPYHKIDSIKKSNNPVDITNIVKQLFFYLQVDQTAQHIELQKAFKQQKKYTSITDYYKSIIDVLIGSLYENDVSTILQSYQLKPQFANTIGQVINFTCYNKMKNADIVVQSLKDKLLYGFDVKFGTIWRKDTNMKNIYATNSGITRDKLKEIYDDFRQKLKYEYSTSLNKVYLLLVCYDMLSEVNFLGQSNFYQSVFQRVPNSIDKVMFVVDVDDLFTIDNSDDNLSGYRFNYNSPYLLDNFLATNLSYYDTIHGHQYSIKLNSDIVMPLDKFIHDKLIIG